MLPETEVAAEDDAPGLDVTDRDEKREQQERSEQADPEPIADAEQILDIVLPPLGEQEATQPTAVSEQHALK